jgi:flagellar biosynthesis protein FlhB
MSDHDRTEQPTPRKLRQARARGEVPQSRLATAALVLFGTGSALALGSEWAVGAWRRLVESLLTASPPAPAEALAAAADIGARTLAAPLAVAVALGALASFLQVGPLWTWRPVSPDASRLDPVRGLGRVLSWGELGPRAGGAALAVGCLALAAVVLVDALPGLLRLGSPAGALQAGHRVVSAYWMRACGLLAAAGGLAIVYRRAQHRRAQRMSRRELRQEQREVEGEPQARRRRAELQREGALGPAPDEALRGAALLVCGPDRAVVLRWDREANAPPEVSLTARGSAAAHARRLAAQVGVPTVLDEPLARALERTRHGLGRGWLARLARHLARAERRGPP